MKTPEECGSIEEVRAEIDALDREVVRLLGARFGFVQAAARFKTSSQSVRAPERFESMLQQRRVWAEAEGLSADAIEKLFRDLVSHFIDEEMKRWKSKEAGES